jgi:hypothetical protein
VKFPDPSRFRRLDLAPTDGFEPDPPVMKTGRESAVL